MELRDPVNRELVRAMVGAAQALGMKTSGESVEDAGTLQLVETLGLDYAQRYYLGAPRAVGELLGSARA